MEFALRLGSPYNGINIHHEVVNGRPISHGCIRTHFKSALVLFEANNVGTPVTIINGPPPADLEYTEDYSTDNWTRDFFVMGDADNAVNTLQRGLSHVGHPVAATGVYDQATHDAVASYQRQMGLNVDGVAGLVTTRMIMSYLNHGF